MSHQKRVLADALKLSTAEKVELVEQILASLYPVNRGVDASWSQEAEERVKAHKRGSIFAISEEEIFQKYEL